MVVAEVEGFEKKQNVMVQIETDLTKGETKFQTRKTI